MSGQHTPGPWRISPVFPAGCVGFSIRAEGKNCGIVNLGVYEHFSADSSFTKEESDANARLIAAAPEFFEQLEILREWTRQVAARGDVPQGIRDASARLHDDCKRICAKASPTTTDAGVVG